jgi:hypothetical protein
MMLGFDGAISNTSLGKRVWCPHGGTGRMDPAMTVPSRQVRARYGQSTITVYQAFSPEVAEPALVAGTFVPPFRLNRMTWIKPSFLWMMYRSGWATKPGQERVLAVQITRPGFEDALRRGCLSHFDPTRLIDPTSWRAELTRSKVRVQWDPERTAEGTALPHGPCRSGSLVIRRKRAPAPSQQHQPSRIRGQGPDTAVETP